MSNYVKSTNFAVKDSLPSGNADKKIKGAEIDTEYNNIATAVNTKADTASPTLTGTPLAPTATYDESSSQLANLAYVFTNFAKKNGKNTESFAANALTCTSLTVNTQTPAVLGINQSFTKAQAVTKNSVTISGNTSIDLSLSNVFDVTIAGSYTLGVSNLVSGGCYTFIMKNTGSYDIDFSSTFKFPGGDALLSSGVNKVDLISCVSDGTSLYCAITYDLTAA